MFLNIKIMGVKSRKSTIDKLAKKLNLNNSNIIYDDRKNGGDSLYTAIKAWSSPISQNATHLMILQDDIELCDDFLKYINIMINNFPNKAFSLFPFDYLKFEPEINDSPYYEATIASACALILPAQYVNDLVEYFKEENEKRKTYEDDLLFNEFCHKNNIQILTTIPSLIQHIGDESIISTHTLIRRTKYFSKIISPNINFYSKKINNRQLTDTEMWINKSIEESQEKLKKWVLEYKRRSTNDNNF